MCVIYKPHFGIYSQIIHTTFPFWSSVGELVVARCIVCILHTTPILYTHVILFPSILGKNKTTTKSLFFFLSRLAAHQGFYSRQTRQRRRKNKTTQKNKESRFFDVIMEGGETRWDSTGSCLVKTQQPNFLHCMTLRAMGNPTRNART